MKGLGSSDYRGKTNGRQGQPFIRYNHIGFLSIPVLEFLNGQPWNDVALGYIHGLRPSHVRVVDDDITQLDAQQWRVTVFLRVDKITIDRICQEVEIGLPINCPNGAGLRRMLEQQSKG